ncbi:hypothetical protein GOP47_0015689 [Adiantum capillus-veneris]|uniref:(+)-abscisic acid 8'-hydroxylase n=1 Tax=Adiantum capillus-veneris TaxID=13818 RepID=A0A9D4UK38_ADICA|nr:hypothetical protein GOP47_0015689 [Adiantum capillus-veneris]
MWAMAIVTLGVGMAALGYLLFRTMEYRIVEWRKKLPPGSMGWPYIGETLQLYSHSPNSFFAAKQRRYGEVFKTHILGCPCVMIASPEAARFVLVSQAHLFKPTFPASKQRMIGPQALFFHEGAYHAKLRKLVVSSFTPDGIRGMVSDIEDLALATLNSWEGQKVNTFMEMKKFSFKVGILKIFGSREKLDMDDLNESYLTLEKGYNSMPINVPGTKYNKSMKARRHLSKIIGKVISERRERGEGDNEGPNFLGTLLAHKDEKGGRLSHEQMVDNIIGLIFASRDTTASVLTWLIKFLKSSPALLDSVTAEQESVRQQKSSLDYKLTWEDMKSMRLTTRVIQETLRVATILSFTFREAVEDVEYKGYIIPKGWKVLPLFRNIHHSPEFFPEPHKFDPSRFEVPPKPNTFLPFGNGMHSCPGSELAKLEMLVFIHHLTTKFRWDFDESKTGVQYSPFQVPQEGLPIRVERK